MVDQDNSDVVSAAVSMAPTPQRRAPPRHGGSRLHEKCNEIRKSHSHQIMIGKPTVDVDKEDYDNDADDDDVDNAEDSEGEEFEQETG